MVWGLWAVITAAALAAILSVVEIARDERMGRIGRGILIGVALALGVVTVIGGRQAAKESQSIQDAVNKIAANSGDDEAPGMSQRLLK